MFYIVRLSSESMLKSSSVRRMFLRTLLRNMHQAFKQHNLPLKIKNQWGRLLIESIDSKDQVIGLLTRIFGVHSVSPVLATCPSEFSLILKAGKEIFQEAVDEAKSFAVATKRSAPMPFTSLDINRELGALLNGTRNYVNLTAPKLTLQVLILADQTYFYSESKKGPSGFPLGVSGRALCLISGGFDSVVAAWLLMKRGILVDFLFLNLAGRAYERSVLEICETLCHDWGYGARPRFFSMDFTQVAQDIRQNVQKQYLQVILKRLFYRAARLISERKGYSAIITGEAIGQVSSQTLQNLEAIEASYPLPLLRPLVAFEKEEIIALNRMIGVFDRCAKIQEFCQLTQDKPATAARRETLDLQEAKLSHEIWEQASKSLVTRVITPGKYIASESIQFVVTDKRPAGSIFIDVREQASVAIDEQTLHIPYFFEDEFLKLDKKRVYVLNCDHGTLSAVIAEKMQQHGYEAYSLEQTASCTLN